MHGDKNIHDTVFPGNELVPLPQFPKLGQIVKVSHELHERHMG